MGEDGIEGAGELAGGGVGEGGVVQAVEDGEGAVEQFEVDLAELPVELSVLFAGELVSELVFDGQPAFEGSAGDIELVGGLAAVAVQLVDEVEGVDFFAEGVAFWHVGWSFMLVGIRAG